MADATHGSVYDKYWVLIRDHRWKASEPDNPKNIIELVVPPEHHKKVIKAIRNRKWREQYLKGRNYGQLFAVSIDDVIRFKLVPPAAELI